MTQVCLRGIAWNHSRALPPLVATAQRYEELHPDVRILWEKRTLHEFGHASLAQLADRFDLLVIDHPMMGDAAESLIDFADNLGQSEVQRLSGLYVGPSFQSYEYLGKLYALPIDAAAPAASFRPDLLQREGRKVPATWEELLDLARLGKVRMPAFPADLFLNWMGMCVSLGSGCAADTETLFRRDVALNCLEALRELASWMPASIYEWNPIALYEAMASGDDFAYCPFAYSYSNYSRRGFASHVLQFAEPVRLAKDVPMRTVLGGTGIAVSRKATSLDHAIGYSCFVADPTVQRYLYGPAGGQPAACAAWEDVQLNAMSQGFFHSTRSGIDTAYVRPRYRGYIPLQEEGGVYLARHMQGQIDAQTAVDAIDRRYRQSLLATDSAHPAERDRPHA